MNCLRCGRNVEKGVLLCDSCTGKQAETAPDSELTANPPAKQKRKLFSSREKKPSQPKPHSAQLTRLRVSLIAACLVCLLLIGAIVLLSFLLSDSRDSLAKAEAEAARLPQVEAERDALSAEVADRDATIDTLRAGVDDLNLQMAALRTDLDDAISAKAKAEENAAKFDTLNKDLSAENDELTKRTQDQADTIKENEETIASLESDLKDVKDDRDSYKQQVNDLSAKVSSLQSELDSANSKIATLNRTITQYETRNTFFNRYVGFVSAGDNKHYHRYGCSKLSLTGAWRVVRIDTTGYTACPNCK